MTREHVHRFSSEFIDELREWLAKGRHAQSEIMTATIAYRGWLEGRFTGGIHTFRSDDVSKVYSWDAHATEEEFDEMNEEEPGKLVHPLKF